MRYTYIVAVALMCSVMPVRGEALEVGQPAPAFEVSYDDSKVLRSADLAGNVIVITCESRETKDINNPFKDAVLQAFPVEGSSFSGIVIVPVVACFNYFWPIKEFCVREVQDSASTLKLRLYVDKTLAISSSLLFML